MYTHITHVSYTCTFNTYEPCKLYYACVVLPVALERCGVVMEGGASNWALPQRRARNGER